MEDQTMQEPMMTEGEPQEITPEDAKAALGNATYLMENMLLPQDGGGDMGMTEQPEQGIEEVEVRALIQEELASFKEELLEILQNEEEPETETTEEATNG